MEVPYCSGGQKASTGKLMAQAPTPISCGVWGTDKIRTSAKEEKEQKGPTECSGIGVPMQGARKEKGADRPQTVSQLGKTDPGEGNTSGPQLQASTQQPTVAEVVQGVDLSQPLQGITVGKVDTSVGPAGRTLGVNQMG